MLVPNANRLAIYKALFKAGVLCAPKDVYKPKHDDIDVPNLHVIKLMQSLVSRGYAREKFSWQWYYWFLTDEGIEVGSVRQVQKIVPYWFSVPSQLPSLP